MVPFSEDDSRRFVGRLEKTRATLEKLAATLDCFVVTVRRRLLSGVDGLVVEATNPRSSPGGAAPG
jgi:hypothetical protein